MHIRITTLFASLAVLLSCDLAAAEGANAVVASDAGRSTSAYATLRPAVSDSRPMLHQSRIAIYPVAAVDR